MSRVFCGRPGAGQNPELDFACLSVSNRKFWRHNFAPPETPTRAGRRAIPHRVRNWTERDPHTRGKKGAPSSNAGYSRITPTRTREEASSLETASSDKYHPHAHAGRSKAGSALSAEAPSPPRARGHKFKFESMRLTDSRKVQKTCTSGYMVATRQHPKEKHLGHF